MASSTIFMKRHDRRPHLDVALQDVDGNAIDLDATVAGVTFTMVDATTKQTIKVNRQVCTIIDNSSGEVRYPWASGDTDTAGVYLGEFEITYTDTTTMTIPTSGTLSIVVMEDYDNA